MNMTNATCDIAGIPLDRRPFDETMARLRSWMGADGSRRVATANLDFLRQCRQDPEFRRCLRTADMVTADGAAVVALSRLGRAPIPERVAGSDLVPILVLGVAIVVAIFDCDQLKPAIG